MSDELSFYVAPLNGSPRRLVYATFGGKRLHVDTLDPYNNFARGLFAKEVQRRLPTASRVPSDADLRNWNATDGGPGANEESHAWIAERLVELADEQDSKEAATEGDADRFRLYTSAELDDLEFNDAAIINNAKIEGQPGGVFGGTKTLKTCIEADACVSVASGTNFLGCEFFSVPRPRRVLFMSAESGVKAMQRLARRIARARGFELSELTNLVWSDTVPFIGDDRDCATIGKIISDNGFEWVVFDPLYLMVDGREAGNLYSQGVQFRRLQEACRGNGADFDLLHHNSRASARAYDPPTLNDAQWSGIAEFVGQWSLLGRREKYAPGSGLHKLWLELGARGEFQNSWAVDVDEHADQWGRPQGWSVSVRPAADVQGDSTVRKARQQDEAAEQKLAADRRLIETAAGKFPSGETKTTIRDRVPLSPNRFNVVWAAMLDDGSIVEGPPAKKGTGRAFPTYKLRPDSDD